MGDQPVTSDVTTGTPVRERSHEVLDGCRVLGSLDVAYADGAEQAVYDIVHGATDVSSMSEELEHASIEAAIRYHLVRSRSNALRSLELRDDLRVLEVGAGCGAVTRYLGERCALVDAVEPMHARARVASLRTRDLAGVTVFIGGIEDVPAEPAYDLVLFNGVLEYVGFGTDEHAPYVSMLEQARTLLRPGGAVACAIENQLGVKYIAGAREDHTARRFDGLEGYPRGTRARTFGRTELEGIFRAAHLEPVVLHAFPDYKATRVVFTDEIFATEANRSLACSLPRFPSVDWWGDGMEPFGSEQRIWRTLVRAGLGHETANSFLVLGRPSDASSTYTTELWPSARIATYFNVDWRASRFASRTDVEHGGPRLRFRRSRLAPDIEPRDDVLELRAPDDEYVSGTAMDQLLRDADADVSRRSRVLTSWRALVERAIEDRDDGDPFPVELIPRNLLVDADDRLVAIDQEWWWHGDVSLESAITFGLIAVVQDLADGDLGSFDPDITVAQLVASLAHEAGVAVDVASDAHLTYAVEVLSRVNRGVEPLDAVRDRVARELRTLLDETVGTAATTRTVEDRLIDAERARDEFEAEALALRAHADELQSEVERATFDAAARHARAESLEADLRELRTSRGWRTLESLRRIARFGR